MTPQTRWHWSLDLSDVFHDDEISFAERRDSVALLIRTAPFYDAEDLELGDIVHGLSEAEDAEEFDSLWEEFYDWADANRVWVATF